MHTVNFRIKEIKKLLFHISRQKKHIRPFYVSEVIVLTTVYLEHIAEAIRHVLKDLVNIKVQFAFGEEGPSQLYIVICPQFFGRLPKKRIVYNFEQPDSLQYFTLANKIMFEKSLGVFDYSQGSLLFHWPDLKNIYKEMKPGAKSFISGFCKAVPVKNKKFDLVFYGALNFRRRSVLDILKTRYSINVIENKTGAALEGELRNASACINLHSYENSPFESVRFLQCLNLDIPVISESSSDQDLYYIYDPALQFVETSNVQAMFEGIENALRIFSTYSDYSDLRSLSHNVFASNFLDGLKMFGFDFENKTFYPRGPNAKI